MRDRHGFLKIDNRRQYKAIFQRRKMAQAKGRFDDHRVFNGKIQVAQSRVLWIALRVHGDNDLQVYELSERTETRNKISSD